MDVKSYYKVIIKQGENVKHFSNILIIIVIVFYSTGAFAAVGLSEPPTYEELAHLLCHGLAGLISGTLIAFGIINNL